MKFLSWFFGHRAAGRSQRRSLEVERLEAREVPAVARWTAYVPHFGDRVDALIRQLAPGTRDPVDFFRNLNGWLATSIAPRKPVWENANAYLAKLAGDCTVRAHLFEAVAQRMGIPVQMVILSGVPYQGMHLTLEVAAHGHWYYFDPTSGSYLASRKAPQTPLGLPQARLLGHSAVVMTSTSPLFRGHWSTQRVFTYRPAPNNLVLYQGRRAFDLWRTYFVSAAVIQGPDVLP